MQSGRVYVQGCLYVQGRVCLQGACLYAREGRSAGGVSISNGRVYVQGRVVCSLENVPVCRGRVHLQGGVPSALVCLPAGGVLSTGSMSVCRRVSVCQGLSSAGLVPAAGGEHESPAEMDVHKGRKTGDTQRDRDSKRLRHTPGSTGTRTEKRTKGLLCDLGGFLASLLPCSHSWNY
jgi:hypothetical protein